MNNLMHHCLQYWKTNHKDIILMHEKQSYDLRRGGGVEGGGLGVRPYQNQKTIFTGVVKFP